METIDKNNLNRLSDDELFQALKKCGLNAGPITGTTRTLYEKRLKNFLESNPARTTTTKVNEPPAQPSTSTKPVIETLTSADKTKPTRSTATKKKAQTQAEKMELDGEAEASIPTTRSSQSNPRVYATTSDENTVPTIPSTQPLRQRETVAPTTTTRTTTTESASVERVSTTARAQPNRYQESTTTTRNLMNDLPSSSTTSSSNRIITHTNKNPIENISSKTNYNDYESSERRYENKTYSSSNIPVSRITNPVTTSSSSYETISRPSTSSYTSLSSTTTKPVLQSSSYSSNIMTTRFEPMQASNTQKDKYAERLENYGLLSRSEMESGSGAYVSTPGYVRSRGPIHSFEKTVEKHVDTPYVNKTAPKVATTTTTAATSADSIQTNVKENKSSMFDINWRSLISVMILTIIVYLLIAQMQPNPVNPIDH